MHFDCERIFYYISPKVHQLKFNIRNIICMVGLAFFAGCAYQPIQHANGAYGIEHHTANPNNPIIYKRGFKYHEIKPVLTVHGEDSIFVNELRFQAVYSPMYTKKMMFDTYGKWDKEIRPNNDRHPILIWENKKLLASSDEHFSVAVNGDETWEEIFASAVVFDAKNRDCLKEGHPYKDSIIHYFSEGLKNLRTNTKFYEVYWRMVNRFDKENSADR